MKIVEVSLTLRLSVEYDDWDFIEAEFIRYMRNSDMESIARHLKRTGYVESSCAYDGCATFTSEDNLIRDEDGDLICKKCWLETQHPLVQLGGCAE